MICNAGVKINHFQPRFAYSLHNFDRATMTIKGTLLLNNSGVKRSVEKNLLKSRFDQISSFFAIIWKFDINLSVITPKGTSVSDFTFFELQHVNICQRVWPVGDYEKKGRYIIYKKLDVIFYHSPYKPLLHRFLQNLIWEHISQT